MSPESTIWLDLCQRLRDVYLSEYQRGYSPLEHLRHPETQRPQLITMIGDTDKSLFVEKCFSLIGSKRHKKIILRSVPEHFNSDAPLFVADCELHNSLTPSALTTEITGGMKLHSLKWLHNIPREMGLCTLAHLIYAQLLLPFSTLVCIFASDFDGTAKVAAFLAAWIRVQNVQPTFPSSTFPRILILVRSKPGSFDEKLATRTFLERLRKVIGESKGLLGQLGSGLTDVEFEKFLKDNFFELRLLALPDTTDDTHLELFRMRLLCESEEVHSFRRVAKVAFSARHFQAFFQSACRHFASNITSPLNLVHASRIPNPVPTDFSYHLKNFVECIPTEHQYIVGTMIASALYLDNFTPGAHIFDPELVFETLYSEILESALVNISTRVQVIDEVKAEFCAKTDFTNTAWLHFQLLQCFTDVWKVAFSNSTCLPCIARAPNSPLPCKHALCDTCVKINGQSSLEEPHKFQYKSCPLCDAPMQISIRLKPPTAGIRLLVLDGGSYADYEILNTLEQRLDLPINIGECFDMVNGSGTGVWITLEKLCENEQYPEEYQTIRRSIQGPAERPPSASRFSQSSSKSHEATLKRLEGAFKVLPRWSGALHSSLKVLSSLSTVFGERTVFEFCQGNVKLCITVSRSKDSRTCLLTNYNGDGVRQTTDPSTCVFPNHNRDEVKKPDYEHVRNGKIKNELQLSQCARMSLSPKSVQGYHGMEKVSPNELIDITLQEQDFLWRREGKAPDVLLALGERIPAYDQTMKSKKIPNWMVDFRLQVSNRTQVDRSVDVLIASFFYVELTSAPQLDELDNYSCRIQVRCRILPSSEAYQDLIKRLRERRARFYFDYQSIPCVNRELVEEASREIAFSRHVEISLPSLQHSLDIKIGGITRTSQSISNCPYQVQQLVEDQGLHCVFGDKDHKVRYRGLILDPNIF